MIEKVLNIFMSVQLIQINKISRRDAIQYFPVCLKLLGVKNKLLYEVRIKIVLEFD